MARFRGPAGRVYRGATAGSGVLSVSSSGVIFTAVRRRASTVSCSLQPGRRGYSPLQRLVKAGKSTPIAARTQALIAGSRGGQRLEYADGSCSWGSLRHWRLPFGLGSFPAFLPNQALARVVMRAQAAYFTGA